MDEDVSDVRNAQRKPERENGEQFQKIAESGDVFAWEVDTQGLYIYANTYVEKILGYTPDDLVGKLHFYELFPGSVREELRSAAFEAFDRRAPFESLLSPNVTKDGRLVILEC